MTTLACAALVLAGFPALLYLRNTKLFRPPGPAPDGDRPQISVLIPARNEERSIGPAVESVLASVGVDLEVIVLDDHSEDRTADVARGLAARDPRVRLERAPPLPADWCGKQHACFVLSQYARHPVLTFLDADVRLAPDALARMAGFLRSSGAELVSGFPREETGTLLEKLVIPLINWLLLCYLPIGSMRRTRFPGLGAGCGQWFMTTREAYEKVGGHAAIRGSLHDGVRLPRAYRSAGFRTDVCDATDLAVCRMYRSAGQVWNGLAKNAREGLGGPVAVWVWTVLLFGGHVLPFALLPVGAGMIMQADSSGPEDLARHSGVVVTGFAGLAALLSLAVRAAAADRFRASVVGAMLHPVGVSILLAIQWYATARVWLGRPVGWKGRMHPAAIAKG